MEEPSQIDNQEIKVDITISRSDDTKASVKSGWADGDVVFIFFKGVAAPKYLEMKYDGEKKWTPTAKHSLLASDLSGAADKKMTAIYLPYGSDYRVVASGGKFLLLAADSDENYSGHFYYQQQQTYTYEDKLKGSISLNVAQPASDEDRLVHFSVTGHDPAHTYYLAQDYMKPFSLADIKADGTVEKSEGHVGNKIPGYVDSGNGIVSFSGILDESAVGVENAKNYRFVIHDKTDLTAYSRTNVGTKPISKNMYIGIGSITDTDNWSHIMVPYFSVSPTKLVQFAPGNLIVNSGVFSFHANQYDITFKDVTAKWPEKSPADADYDGSNPDHNPIVRLLATPDRDLFRWDELTTETSIGPGVTSTYSKITYASTEYESINFGTINGHEDWHLAPDFMYLLGDAAVVANTGSFGSRDGTKYAKAVLTKGNGFPDLYLNATETQLGGTSGAFIFPDNWNDDWNTLDITRMKNNTGSMYNAGYSKLSGTVWGSSDTITMEVYLDLISKGAIFIPCNGLIDDTPFDPEKPTELLHNGPRNVGNIGGSWSGSRYVGMTAAAHFPNLFTTSWIYNNPCGITQYRAVRLCRDLN